MAGQLAGKITLVTGGGSGIGKATSLAFAREDAKVVVADVNVAGGEETVRLIQDTGGDATFVSADVAQASQVEAMVQEAMRVYGRLDCAFNNAGVSGVRG
jgi:NAD(P)-dependent dehydrogenase (short-subunit alcohol dehydrogenase family)